MGMGGFNERFIQLGGGFANFDFFCRAPKRRVKDLSCCCAREPFTKFTAARQLRQEESTGSAMEIYRYEREYEHIVGQAFTVSTQTPALFGRVTHSEIPRLFFGKYSKSEELCSRV